MKRNESPLLDAYFVQNMHRIFDPIPVPIILVNKETEIMVINEDFAEYLGHTRDELIGKKVNLIDPNTRFPYVFKSKRPEIAYKHKFSNGHTALVHRIPVLDDDGEVLYGFGMVIFDDLKNLQEVLERNKLLEGKLSIYQEELKNIRGAKYSWDTIIGNSLVMQRVKVMASKSAKTDSNVLIMGESGTGKELFAHAIHNDSKRFDGPFVKINCAAIPKDLLESELFGYEEGAFTGAKKQGKIGKFELANGGTIFLDEIGDMPLDMQVKILRVLQEREIERIGSNKTIPVDCRIIAATNRNLLERIRENEFREDLYYRLNVINIEVPPLRERKEDIELLSLKLMEKLSNSLGHYVSNITVEALECLKAYNWPGNIRELENIIERAINMVDNETIELFHLPQYILVKNQNIYTEIPKIQNLKEAVEEVEKTTISNCLIAVQHNKLKAAKLLGISRTSLYEKIEKYKLL
ncbi:sigma-54 interaction domain-containing protein [Fusibacter ferrireducens]|uniref:Sigma 54-interacting transcriptional regulator n=1 Tax=Fusibacter ferrireducens TaxID=2785058 RepID=A0ABR9ZYY0_9FIRM|nr:sigma 54-interacting transcriptional regulator [Fusibacter ferrireducens]MBF4695665.1 sigma 54-interacting transcriptional regulator [Fusibacter ferrireducens]